jgi:glycosyltransferase involved in cell wall biosynthesis
VAIEKNIKAFLDLDLPGTKWVVGGGPQLKELKRRYQDVHFFGSVDTEELGQRYAEADCFVFPSRTDTFGLVMVEALASGVPVAGYPVPGPLDVVTDPKVGAVDEDLRAACLAAVKGDPQACRRHAETFTWANCAAQFLATLHPIPRSAWQPMKRRVLPDAAAS